MTLRRQTGRSRAALLLPLLLAACSDSGGSTAPLGPGIPPRIITVSVTPANLILQAGEEAMLAAHVLDAQGPIVDREFQWTSLNPAVATVDADGNVTAHQAGLATIQARHANTNGSATIDVRAAQADDPGPRVDDLAVAAANEEAAVVTFTDVDGLAPDGGYEIRFQDTALPWAWNRSRAVTRGTCIRPRALAGSTTVNCDILGLAPGTSYHFQVATYQGKPRQYQGLSNLSVAQIPGTRLPGGTGGGGGSTPPQDQETTPPPEGGSGEAPVGGSPGGSPGTPLPPPPPAPPTPNSQRVFFGDFSAAGSDPVLQGMVNITTPVNVHADPGVGMRYDFLGPNQRQKAACADHSLSSTVHLPSGTKEVWMRFRIKFSSNWTTVNPSCSSPAPDYKTVLTWLDSPVSMGHGRFDFKSGTNAGDGLHASVPGYPSADAVPVSTVRLSGARNRLFDGAWHTVEIHESLVGDDEAVFQMKIDGVVTHNYRTHTVAGLSARWLRQVNIGANRNLAAPSLMHVWWDDFEIYVGRDPGFGFPAPVSY